MKLSISALLFLSILQRGFPQTYNVEIHNSFFKDNPYNNQQLTLVSKNALSILVMWDNNQLLINGEPGHLNKIKQRVKVFISNPKQEI